MFIGLRHSPRVYPFHIVVVDECTQNGLHRTAPPFGKASRVVLIAVKFLMHLVVKRFVYAFLQFFKFCYLAATHCPKRTIFTVFFAAAVALLLIAFAIG